MRSLELASHNLNVLVEQYITEIVKIDKKLIADLELFFKEFINKYSKNKFSKEQLEIMRLDFEQNIELIINNNFNTTVNIKVKFVKNNSELIASLNSSKKHIEYTIEFPILNTYFVDILLKNNNDQQFQQIRFLATLLYHELSHLYQHVNDPTQYYEKSEKEQVKLEIAAYAKQIADQASILKIHKNQLSLYAETHQLFTEYLEIWFNKYGNKFRNLFFKHLQYYYEENNESQ